MDTKTITKPCTSIINHVHQPVNHQPCTSTYTIPTMYINHVPYHVHQPCINPYQVHQPCTISCTSTMYQTSTCTNITKTCTSYMYQEYASHHAPNMCLKHIPMPQQDTKGMTITSSTSNQDVPQTMPTSINHVPQACANIHKPCTKRYHQTCAISLMICLNQLPKYIP
jgi:hypothetical protein